MLIYIMFQLHENYVMKNILMVDYGYLPSTNKKGNGPLW